MIIYTRFLYLLLSLRLVCSCYQCAYLNTFSSSEMGTPVWLARIFTFGMLRELESFHLASIIQLHVHFQAYYIFWVEIGRRMGMQDIPDSLEEMKAWSAVCIIS